MATRVRLLNNVPIETVGSILGHKNIRTTQIYDKITKEKVKKGTTALAAQLNSSLHGFGTRDFRGTRNHHAYLVFYRALGEFVC